MSPVSSCLAPPKSLINSFPDVLKRSVSEAHTLLESVIVLGSQMEGRFVQDVTEFVKWKRLSYPHNCLTLDLTGALTPEQFLHADMISINFKSDPEAIIEVIIEDRLSALERDNPEARRGFLGPVIEQKLDEKTFKKYVVEFSQSVFVEEDPFIGCKDYPWEGFSSFDDCDKEFMQDWVTNKYNFLPFFMAKVESNATVGPVKVDFNCTDMSAFEAYAHYNGYIKSACPIPCTQTQVKLNKLITEKWDGPPSVELIMSDKVMVTYNYYPKFSPAEALASLGGSLGLWLGLGVLQLLQLILATSLTLVGSFISKEKTAGLYDFVSRSI